MKHGPEIRKTFATIIVLAATAAAAAPAPASPPPAAEWIPADAIAVLEIAMPGALLDPLLDPGLAASVATWPAYQKLATRPQFQQFLGIVRYVELVIGTDWRTGLRKLFHGGITLAVTPGEANLLIIDAEEAAILQKIHETFLGFARAEATKRNEPDRVGSKQVGDATVWWLGPDEAHAIIGSRLVLSNKPALLEKALAMRAGSQDPRLSAVPGYIAAREAAGPDAAAAVFVNLALLKMHPPIAQALAGTRNPMASLLLAGVMEALRGSTWLSLGLRTEKSGIALEAAVDGKADATTGAAAFALAGGSGGGAWPNLAVPRRIAAVSLYRDLHRFYAAKDTLFPERTSELIFFENMMGIFFSGRNLTEEVLAETKPEIRIVAAEQVYDPAIGTPRTRLPAFALILRLRDAQSFDEVMEEAWQKALGLINFTRGQKAQPGLIIDKPVQGATKFTMAYFSTVSASRAGSDDIFNFRPSLAMPADYVILSSTEALARDLIDALDREAKGSRDPVKDTDGLIEIDGAHLASILASNEEAMIRQNMVEKGNTRNDAELAIETLLAVARSVTGATLRTGTKDGSPRVRLEIGLNPPPPPPSPPAAKETP